MKKIASLLAVLLAAMLLFAACAPNATTVSTQGTTGGTEAEGTTGTNATTSTTAQTTPPTVTHEKKSIKILAIGNSFSVDAMEWLGYILMDMGYNDIYLGNLYIGGCSLDTHWDNIQNSKEAYEFYYSQYGTWSKRTDSVNDVIKLKEWDVITIQQVSQNSGMTDTFGNLQNILDFIHANKTNKDAKVYWHMTWAYEGDSTHSGFANYNKDQMTMYNAIVNAVKTSVLTNSSLDGFIPSGTAIQNLRTSYHGDRLTRDGYHLSYDVGRYTAALTWAKLLTGKSIDNVTYVPKQYPNVKNHLASIKEAVNNAVEKPLEVTPATITTHESTTMTQDDKDFLTAQGKNPDDYYLIDLDVMLGSYYNSGSNSTRNSKYTNDKSLIRDYYFSTDMFDRNDLPYGTIIRVNEGYQYRPEAWVKTSEKTSPRPDNTTENVVVVDAAWWGSYNYRAFNVAREGANVNVTEEDISAFKIYVPKAPAAAEPEPTPTVKPEASATTTDEAMTLAGFDLANYTKVDITEYLHEYYLSTSSTGLQNKNNGTASNYTYFWATQKFAKEDLPEGTVIVVLNGYQYRPEGWQTSSSKNTAARPDNVLGANATVTVVDAAWWGNFNYRAFNVAKQGNSVNVSESDYVAFAIYVPKA